MFEVGENSWFGQVREVDIELFVATLGIDGQSLDLTSN